MRPLIALFALFAATSAAAEPRLIATLDIDASRHDLATQTEGALEDGVSGSILGGLGSGLAYAGGDTFLMLPDRGPNATPYDASVDNTTRYYNRFHSFRFQLESSNGGLPFTVKETLEATTLLWSSTALTYKGEAPTLNAAGRFYFNGRSDQFDVAKGSVNPANARFDPEGIRVSADGKSVFVSDEYGPCLYQFDRATGQRLKSFVLPAKFAAAHLSSKGDEEIAGNDSGRVANKGMEGLAITPDGRTLVGIMQSPLAQDGGTKAPYVRILTVDIATGATHEYAYGLSNIGTAEKPKYAGISEIVAVNDHQFLIDERDGKGRGAGGEPAFKNLFLIDLKDAVDVSGLTGAEALAGKAVSKTVFLDMVATLKAGGIDHDAIPEKIEGVSFGPDVTLNGAATHTLWIASDNDFLSTLDGKPNPNSLYVFGFSDTDLPGYVPQVLAK
ncbi:MAG: esterase-like activity of phytase family protein [Asticcacaulis sp.]|uniref:esterase-like activity of phytase family protein n=1 Tax=Asticcacaulis sp. TaxID=1872648 RepID=UPI0039E38593